VSDKKFLDSRLYLDCYPIPGKWLPNGCMATSGSMLRMGARSLRRGVAGRIGADAAASEPGTARDVALFLRRKDTTRTTPIYAGR